MWVVNMGNFQKWPKSAKNEFSKMCEKILHLTKDIAKEIKQGKMGPYKYHSPQIMGYNVFGGKVEPKSSQALFSRKNT